MIWTDTEYINGNYYVKTDGLRMTKRALRFGEDFKALFPDSIDLKISNRCSHGCPFCHESSTKNGDLCDFEQTIKVLDQLPKIGIEIAIGGGNVLETPEETKRIIDWLVENNFRPRITITWEDMWNYRDRPTSPKLINEIFETVGGEGISLTTLPDTFKDSNGPLGGTQFSFERSIAYHIIAGVFPTEQLGDLIHFTDRPILVLGYKQWGRAKNTTLPDSIPEFERVIKQEIYKLRKFGEGPAIVFDNLAIEQLHIQDSLLEEEWNQLYLGEEGSCSMYIDAVRGEFARTSRSEDRKSWNEIGLLDYFQSLC